jgi:hypothetical protein
MTTTDLKELALAATPGPWTGFVDKGRLVAIMPSGRPGDICTFADPPSDADAAFMLAATPDAILALYAERDEARERETCAKLEHAAAEAALSAERAEVERLLSAMDREEAYLHRMIDASEENGGIMHGDLEGAFHRIRDKDSDDAERAEALTKEPPHAE